MFVGNLHEAAILVRLYDASDQASLDALPFVEEGGVGKENLAAMNGSLHARRRQQVMHQPMEVL